MTPQHILDKSTRLLLLHEGERLEVYLCSKGKKTIGVGRNIEDKGLTKEECDCLNLGVYSKLEVIKAIEIRGITRDESRYLLNNDIEYFYNQLVRNISFYSRIHDTAQIVLLDMCLNMGLSRLLGFKNTLKLLSEYDYEKASIEMLNSSWHDQVGDRSVRLSGMLFGI